MGLTIGLFIVGTITVLICATKAAESKAGDAWFLGLIAVFIFALDIFGVAPAALGLGHVSALTEKYGETLDKGVSYQTVFTVRDDNTQVLLLRKDGTSVFRAIRVEGTTLPPEHFTLVNEQPVAITPPIAPVPPSK